MFGLVSLLAATLASGASPDMHTCDREGDCGAVALGSAGKECGRSQVDDFDAFGPAIGCGAVWLGEDVKAGQASAPYQLGAFDSRTLYVAGDLEFDVEVDAKGDGTWKPGALKRRGKRIYDLRPVKGRRIRLVAKRDASRVTAFFNCANEDLRAPQAAKSVASRGFLRAGKGDGRQPLEYCADGVYYTMSAGTNGLVLAKTDDAAACADLVKEVGPETFANRGDAYDEASAIVTDADGRRWRFPRATGTDRPGRLRREGGAGRDFLNLAGLVYELPSGEAGGYAKARAVAAPGEWMYDFCAWRGLFVVSGLVPADAGVGRVVTGDDGGASLWVGAAGDLWKFGKPRGAGGPWKDTLVRAGEPSDPYLMSGFDGKYLTVASTNGARITIEIDITGAGTWIPFASFTSAERDNISRIRGYWLRAISDKDSKATVQLEYN